MSRYLVTIQAYVETDSATEAENIAMRAATHLEESNEDPQAGPTTIQTCVVEKAPFFPIGPRLWTGESCEEEIELTS